MDARITTWAPWVVAGVCLFLVPCSFCAGWLIPRGQDTPVAALPGPDGVKPNARPISKPREEWGYQDIQDHLAANGVKMSRGFGRAGSKAGMWFVPGNGTPIDRNSMEGIYHRNEPDDFFIEEHDTPAAAKKRVADLADVQQEQATAWSKYVIFGDSAKRAELKTLLP